MIERLLAADAALERGELDIAEKLFGSVAEADPRNAIAAVGMGRVAAGRDDADGARTWFQLALSIDPDEAAAQRLLTALEREVAAERVAAATSATASPREALSPANALSPVDAPPPAQGRLPAADPLPAADALRAADALPVERPRETLPSGATTAPATPPAEPAVRRPPSLIDRIRFWLGLSGRR